MQPGLGTSGTSGSCAQVDGGCLSPPLSPEARTTWRNSWLYKVLLVYSCPELRSGKENRGFQVWAWRTDCFLFCFVFAFLPKMWKRIKFSPSPAAGFSTLGCWHLRLENVLLWAPSSHCKLISGIAAFYPLGAQNIHLFKLGQPKNMSRHCQMPSGWKGDFPLSENCCPRGNNLAVTLRVWFLWELAKEGFGGTWVETVMSALAASTTLKRERARKGKVWRI